MDVLAAFLTRAAAPGGATLKDLSDSLGDASLEALSAALASCPLLVGAPPEVFMRPADAGAVPEPLRRLAALRRHRERDAQAVHALIGLRPDGIGEAVLGRVGGEAHVQLPVPSASRRHCRLQRHDDGLELVELGSRNGTSVEGRRVSAVGAIPLRAGMRLTIGTWEALLLGAKAVWSVLRDADWDPAAPLAQLAGVPVPAEGIALRDLVPAVAALSRDDLLAACPFGLLLEVPLAGQDEPTDLRGRTRRFSQRELAAARRSKQTGRARVHLLAPRDPERRAIVLGRDPTRCDVVLTDPSVSSIHAEVYDLGDRWSVGDRDSENGTFVRGERVAAGDPGFAAVRDPVWFGRYRAVLLEAAELHRLATKLVSGATHKAV